MQTDRADPTFQGSKESFMLPIMSPRQETHVLRVSFEKPGGFSLPWRRPHTIAYL